MAVPRNAAPGGVTRAPAPRYRDRHRGRTGLPRTTQGSTVSTSTDHDPTERGARRGRARLRTALAAATATVVGAGLALGGAAGAQAAEGSDWGTFTVAGTARAYTGTMALDGGFPATTFTSTARQATVISGASVWQADATPPGQLYGSSRGQTYLNLRPDRDVAQPDAASVSTYSFAGGSPASGWSFVLGDVDADQVTVTATGLDGDPVAPADLGFEGVHNSCGQPGGWSCDAGQGADLPVWDEATGVLSGNATAADTQGATGWFSPTVPLASLTLTFQMRAGQPVYQTWFATRTFALSGTATLDGAPYPGATVTVTDAAGRTVATLPTGDDGGYVVPALVATDGYQVTIAPPADSGLEPVTLPADLTSADATGLDAAFVSPAEPEPAATVVGTIVDQDGGPVPDLPVAVVTDEATPVLVAEGVTEDDGGFALEGLPLDADLVLLVDGDPVTEIPFTTPAAPDTVDLGTVTVQVAGPPVVTPPAPDPGQPAPQPAPVPQPAPQPAPATPAGSTRALAYTGSEPQQPLGLAAALLLAGAVLTTVSALRRRSR